MMLPALLAVLSLQEPAPAWKVAIGEPTERGWPVTVEAKGVSERVLEIVIRRYDRRWEPGQSHFFEIISDSVRRRAVSPLDKRSGACSVSLRPTLPGSYNISANTQEKMLHETRATLGRVGPLFTATIPHVEILTKAAEKAAAILQQLEKIGAGGLSPTEELVLSIMAKLNEAEHSIRETEVETDLTATHNVLRDIFYHLRNSQLLIPDTKGKRDERGMNDGEEEKKGRYLDANMTDGALARMIASITRVVSLEAQVSVAMLLENLCERAAGDVKLTSKLRDAAKDALKLARKLPEQSEPFNQLLEAAAKDSDLAVFRASLQEIVAKNVKR